MRCSTPVLIMFLGLLMPTPSNGQRTAEEGQFLGFRFFRPASTALQQAMDGLHVLDGVFVERGRWVTDTKAEIIGRVQGPTWLRNPEVVGGVSGVGEAERLSFGPIQSYLRGDPRFRIVAIPASCENCGGDRRVVFLPFADSTGYLVGSKKGGS